MKELIKQKNIFYHLKVLCLFSILLSAYSLLQARSAYADFRIGVFPPIMQINANVPVAIKKDITLVNAGNESVTLNVVWKMFEQGPYNNGQVQYIPDSQIQPDKQIFQKMQLLDDTGNVVATVTLGPQQKRTYTIHIGLPKDEPGADYYFSIIFENQQTSQAATNGSSITAGIATNMLLSIGPKDQTQGILEEFSAPWFVQTGPVPFTVLVDNLSRHFISSTGAIYIRNMFGQLIGKVDLLPVNVLGQSSRYLPSKGSATDSQHPVAVWPENVLFGPYRANIVLTLSSDGPVLKQTIYFFAMPVQYIIGFFFVVVIVGLIWVRVRNKVASS